MAGSLGSLTIDLAANITRFERALNRAERMADKRSKNMVRTFKRAATGIGLALSTLGLVRATENAFNFADSIAKAAERADVSTDRIQELRYTMEQFGVTTQQTDDGLRRFTRRLGVALEGGSFAKAFSDLGVALRDVDGSFRGTEAILDDTIDALAAFDDQATRSAFAAQVFGDDAGPQLSVALAGGTEALREYAHRARESGAIMRADIIQAAEDANDRLSELTNTLKVQFSTALIQSAPAIEAAARGLLNFVVAIGKAIGGVSAMNMEEVEQRITNLSEQIVDARRKLNEVEDLRTGDMMDRMLGMIMPSPETLKTRIATLEQLQMEAYERMGELNLQVAERAERDQRNPLTGMTDEELAASNKRTLDQIMWLYNRSREIDDLLRDERIQNEQTVADFKESSNASIKSNAVGLLQILGRENKKYARAAIILQKGLAIAEATMNTAVAYTAALKYGPVYAAGIAALGAAQIALIAGTGIAQYNQLNRSGTAGAPPGTSVNPVITSPTDLATGQPLAGGTSGTITINVNGVVTEEILNDLIIPAIQDAANEKDVILFRSDSRQAAELIV